MQGVTVWLTGLPCSGKTTIGRSIAGQLNELGLPVELLDADDLRLTISKGLGFSRSDREENLRRIAFVCGSLARHGVIAVVSAIAPYRSIRDEIREELGRFVEVYVNAPLGTCEFRDVKGMYKRAREGRMQSMTGIDSPYEYPLSPEVECCTDSETVEESAEKVMSFLGDNYQELFREALEEMVTVGHQDGDGI